jgi:hypothetical protein
VAQPDSFNYTCSHEEKLISNKTEVPKRELIVELKYAKFNQSKDVIKCTVEHQISSEKKVLNLELLTGEKSIFF